jgi:hypothetical protein
MTATATKGATTPKAVGPAQGWPASFPDGSLLQLPGEARREQGRSHFTDALVQLLRHVSHPQLSELADWACNEAGNLHTSQISHLRNSKMRMLGIKCVDALGRINQAAWAYHHQPALMSQLGTAPLTPRLESILKGYAPLLHPSTEQPLGAGEVLAVYLGYLQLPISPPLSLSSRQAEVLAEKLGGWLDQAFSADGISFREAGQRLRSAWCGESFGVERLLRVVAGMEDYSPRQLADDWERIATSVAAALGRSLDPQQLAEELLGEALEPAEKKVALKKTAQKKPTAKPVAAKAPAEKKPRARRGETDNQS